MMSAVFYLCIGFFISDVEREKYKSGASSGTFIFSSRGANIGSIPRAFRPRNLYFVLSVT
jgi:hypothetical protein